ncbi:sodium:solute symporter [Luteitalea sp.]|uniref:sodium:solute symporter n=1 Tax=Luteitalea sp. TaxID=2004800 RepID=UPI0025BBE5FB|nr:sodium:solute symporter [Luteitalea sp.]
MHPIDWFIIALYLAWIIWTGVGHTRGSKEIEGYFLGNRSNPWWAVGLSVMATQLSAITMVGTTGQGYTDGLRFVQFYFGLPLAMVILAVTAVPFFHRARVYTAYEYLERRFDVKTRTLTSALFLLSRGLSCGTIISAPAVILSIIMGWNLTLTVLLIGIPTAIYTMLGGVQAVTWTDVKQMYVIVFGLVAVAIALVVGLPGDVSMGDALRVAGATGRMQAFDFRFTLNETYTFWSGLIGGLFLMLSYFGCDQSQVQRYLTARSEQEATSSLYMSAYWKIPLQVLVLMIGILVFVFYLFTQPPMLFNPVHESRVKQSALAGKYAETEQRFTEAFNSRRDAAKALATTDDASARAAAEATFLASDAALKAVRRDATTLVQDVTGDRTYRDVNYVFPTFVTTHLPIGLIGIVLAAIMAAAMSSIASELNALATTTVIDFYRRLVKPDAPDAHYLLVSRVATGFWGIFACVVALFATNLGSLIEVVNRFGSFFYGSILGVFMLAMATRRASGTGAFVGLMGGMALVASVAVFRPDISFLWHNVIGALGVVIVGLLVSVVVPATSTGTDAAA